MNKKTLGFVLMCVSVNVLIFTLVLYCISAVFVGDVEDVMGYSMGYGYSKTDINISADTLRGVFRLYDGMTDGMDFIDELGIDGVGFKVFALFGRGWFLAAGVLLALAGAVLMALDKDGQLGSDLWSLIKRFGKAFAAGVVGFFTGMRKPAARQKYACPQCGAPYSAGVLFCGKCGTRLPDPATIGVCKHCGTRNEPDSKFCAGCGQPLN